MLIGEFVVVKSLEKLKNRILSCLTKVAGCISMDNIAVNAFKLVLSTLLMIYCYNWNNLDDLLLSTLLTITAPNYITVCNFHLYSLQIYQLIV